VYFVTAGTPDFGVLDPTEAQERLLDAVWHIYTSNDEDCHPRGAAAEAFRYVCLLCWLWLGCCPLCPYMLPVLGRKKTAYALLPRTVCRGLITHDAILFVHMQE
jgi:hypothetical protein